MSNRSGGGTSTPARVARALLGFELHGAVGRADRDGQGIDVRLLHKVLDLFGFRIGGLLRHHRVLDAGQHAELALDGHIMGMGVFHHLSGQLHIVLVGMVRPVDHDRRESRIDAGLAELEGVAMVQVQGELDRRLRRP